MDRIWIALLVIAGGDSTKAMKGDSERFISEVSIHDDQRDIRMNMTSTSLNGLYYLYQREHPPDNVNHRKSFPLKQEISWTEDKRINHWTVSHFMTC